ncbi:MAG: polysaccharide deacetylase family protein [Chthonomonadales bacterium]
MGLKGGSGDWCLPILMYHHVGAEWRNRPQHFLNVTAGTFARQMRFLARAGYRAVSFAEAARALAARDRPGRRLICITFDDGYASVARNAAPVLEALNWPATVFVPTAWAGRRNEWDEAEGRPVQPIMGWDALAELAARGWEIGAHTRTHPHLELLAEDTAWEEISGCRRDMQERLGIAPCTFCYPFGTYNASVKELVRRAGYTAACTTRSGLAYRGADPMEYPRVKVAYRDGLPGMLYRLWIRPRLG